MKKKSQYYSRLLILNVSVFSVIILLLSILTFFTLRKNNFLEVKREYEDELVKLESQIAHKHDDFYKIFLPISTSKNHAIWSQFLSGNLNPLSYEDNLGINEVFQNMSLQDSDVKAIVIAKVQEKKFYVYIPRGDGLVEVPESLVFCKELLSSPNSRETYGTDLLVINKGKSSEFQENVYMITGKSFKSDAGEDVVKLGICYSTDALASGLTTSFDPSSKVLFGISTLNNQTIYSSKGEYGKKVISNSTITSLKDSSEATPTSDKKYFIESRSDKTRNYMAFYQIPYNYVSKISGSEKLLLVGTVTVSISLLIILSMISNSLMKKRMKELIVGMDEIGENNLEYRIPIDSDKNDEFTEISSQFNNMSDRLQNQINKTYVYELEKKNSEFRALQSIINPHFLYNTLEAIREWLDQKGEEDGAEMILILSRLLKYQIRGGSIATIGEELRELKTYINLFSLRHDGEFQYELMVDDEVLPYKIPKYSLQPILENYFVHGYRSDGNNRFSVEAHLLENKILFTIKDNGIGISQEGLESLQQELLNSSQSKIGLSNVHNRLQLAFGTKYGVNVSSIIGEGTTVTILIPAVLSTDEFQI